MSREVEVTGLKMVATVPEDLQISVGQTTTKLYLNDDASFLVTNAYTAGSGTTQPNEDNMWSNTVDLSHYYEFGRLIPASSTSGTNIFFTPDAKEQGKNIRNDARFIAAANGLTAQTSGSSSYMATLHPKTSAEDAWKAPSGSNYSGATSYAVTNDDGYYIDVPVWIRTSTKEAVDLTVKGYVKPANSSNLGISEASGTKVELYKATRVAILSKNGDSNNGTKGLVNLKEGSGTGWNGTTSIIDYYGTNASHGVASGAVNQAGQANGTEHHEGSDSSGSLASFYGTAQVYDGTTSIATIAGAGDSSEYGTPTMLWIRVWLEGEDPQCWNQNAGQDWNISLKFEKK